MTRVETMRPLPAGRLLAIRRDVTVGESDEAVRGLLCNARVLSECCFSEGEPVFADAEAVLSALTVREMEALLRRLSGEAAPLSGTNPQFDEARFCALQKE